MEKKKFLPQISSVEILNALFGFLSIKDLKQNAREYFKFLEEIKSLLRLHLVEKKSTSLTFLCEDGKEIILDGEILEVEEAYALMRVVKTHRSDSWDFTNSTRKLFFVVEKRFINEVRIYDHAPSLEILHAD